MSKHRLLLISTGHHAIRPGGLESYVRDLYEAFRESDEFEPILLARAGEPFTEPTPSHGWSPWAMAGADPNQYLFYTDVFRSQWDRLNGRWRYKDILTRFYRDFLLSQRPDIVNFQHTWYLGYDIVRVTKQTLPEVPLVYNLHEYLPICFRDGQMVRTGSNELCQKESPRRCNECFPEVSRESFFARKRFIQSHLSLIDRFVAPSDYVKDRYVDWGIPAKKIQVEPQGMVPVSGRVEDRDESRPRNRFAFFGQINPYKGADVLLEAIELLGDDFDGHLWIFGANLEIQPIEIRDRVRTLVDRNRGTVTFAGPYKHSELGKLMAGIDWVVVPSIWWETGPIVVLEAFQHGRPVICSDIGGMSEKVTDGLNGLHFRRRDSRHLAETMARAAEAPGLWEELRAGIPADPPRWMDDHVRIMSDLYKDLSRERASESTDGAALAGEDRGEVLRAPE
jgi:glycosyltransferase involved in cell wall biosynthesis